MNGIENVACFGGTEEWNEKQTERQREREREREREHAREDETLRSANDISAPNGATEAGKPGGEKQIYGSRE